MVTLALALALAWRVLCALTAHKPAHGHGHGHGHGGKVEGNIFLRELRHKGSWCCSAVLVLGHCATYTHPKAQPAALHCSLAA